MHVHIDALWIDVQTKINEGMSAFGEESRVSLLQGLLDGRGFDGSVIDEKEDGGFLDMVVRIAGISGGGESPFRVGDFEGNEFVGYGGSMDLPDAVYCAGVFGHRETD